MTMHLMGHAYDTVYRGRRKVKITKRDHERLQQEWRDYNKFAGQNHLQKVTFEEYLDKAFGRNKVKTVPTYQTFRELEPAKTSNYRRDEGVHYPSRDCTEGGACVAPERKEYTGDLLEGIATMHKSNAVPVMKGTDEAKDIARMRR